MKKKEFLLISIVVTMLSACTDDARMSDVARIETIRTDTAGTVFKNKLLHDYACVLAKALPDADLRAVIRDQVARKRDGDFDVLVGTLQAERLDGQCLSVLEKLRSVCPLAMIGLRSSIAEPVDTTMLDITHYIPNVQVSVPVHAEEWDPATFVPMVAVLPYDYVEKPGNLIDAYDSEGRLHRLSADEEPDVPVVVVGRSERIGEDGLPVAGLLPTMPATASEMFRSFTALPDYPAKLYLNHGPARSLLLEWTDVADETGYEVWRMSGSGFQKVGNTVVNDNNYVDAGLIANTKYWYKVRAVNQSGVSSWSPVMATTASNRNENEWLKIKRMKFSASALKAVEGWISGAPEIRLRVIQGSEGGATNVFTSGRLEPENRGDICDQWWGREVTLFAWSTSVYGTVLTFDWREEDWLQNVDFTLTGSYEDKSAGGTVKVGGTVYVKGDEGDDIIGNTSVMWWQEKAQVYDLSGFQWQFVY